MKLLAFSQKGLVGHWRFDLDDARDYSPEGNDGTEKNFDGDEYVAGMKLGRACDLDGIDDTIEVPDDDSLDITDGITVSAWFKSPETPDGSAYTKIVIKWQAYSINFDHVNIGGLSFQVYDGGAWQDSPTPTTQPAANQWHHVVGFFDGDNIGLYLDGEFVGSTSWSGTIDTNANSLYIGSQTGGSNFFNGIIDDVHVYNRTLSAQEIKRLYAAGKHPQAVKRAVMVS